MADLKEETTVDNTDPNQAEEAVERKKPIDPSLEGIQLIYEKNKKAINYVGGGLLVVIAAFVFFKFYYLPGQEKAASNEVFWAQSYFETDSFNIALKGISTDGRPVMVNSPDQGLVQMKGFEQIADEYSMTKVGSLANYCAGVCYLRLGKFDQAIDFLSKYNGNDAIITPVSIGAIGDCHMELNRTDEAVKYYLKAADKSANNFTSPYFLKKAAFAYKLKADYSKALESYERIKKEYPASNEAKEVERDIAEIKALGNL